MQYFYRNRGRLSRYNSPCLFGGIFQFWGEQGVYLYDSLYYEQFRVCNKV